MDTDSRVYRLSGDRTRYRTGMESLTRTILRQLQASYGVSVIIRTDEETERVSMTARTEDGASEWKAEGEDDYSAACSLAEAMGFDLMDG